MPYCDFIFCKRNQEENNLFSEYENLSSRDTCSLCFISTTFSGNDESQKLFETHSLYLCDLEFCLDEEIMHLCMSIKNFLALEFRTFT